MKPEHGLENLGKKILNDIKKKENPNIDIPIRALSNVEFDSQKGYLKLGKNSAKRYFFNIAHIRKFVQTVEIASISKLLLENNKHASLRDVFYMAKRTIPGTKTNIVDEQTESDDAIEDLELITGTLREELNVNANKLGAVAGNVIIEDSGDKIDWARLGSGGWSVPSAVEAIKFKKVDAKFLLYMEKAAVWERLHEDKFWKKMNCIIMCSQGQATRGVRRLIQRLHTEYNLPVYVLTDFDPWGIYIYSVLKCGSINLAHISDKLAIPKAKFLGITADDIEKYDLKKHFIKLKDVDKSRINQLAEYTWFKNNKKWQREFQLMKKYGCKAEIQALSSRGITFISDKYLPEKIKNKDFLD